MTSSVKFFTQTRLHIALVWALYAAVLYTDFLTPLGFAHGLLFVPVLIYAMLLPGGGIWFQRSVLICALLGTLLLYILADDFSDLSAGYVISNRVLSVAALWLTYFYLRRLTTIKQQNVHIKKLEHDQRQMLDDFIDAMPLQVWLADNQGVVDFVSKSLVAFTGKSKEVILDDWLAILHPDDREKTIEVWSHSVETGKPYHIEFRLRRYDGIYIWFYTKAIPQRDEHGHINRWLGSSIDIEDLRRLQIESERLAAQFRHTIESITDAFFTLDHDFHFDYLNQRTAEILDSTVEDLAGQLIWEKDGVGYDSDFAVQYRLAAQTQQKINFEAYFPPSKKWLQVNVYPSLDGLTVYLSDITKHIEMEEKLRESQKLEAVGHLTGGVAHDFNNLLTVILGNAETLADLETNPKLKLMAQMTLSAAQRGAELTSRLLAFSRRQPLAPKPTDLNQLVQAMLGLIRRTLPEDITIEFIPVNDLGITEIDANELDAALLNLVVNARDAMQNGGKLTIETRNTTLDSDYVAYHPDVIAGDYIMLCVSDTGAGMTPDTLARAFEPFFTTKSEGQGSGLGLSMVFGFTKQSGGHIQIYSELGEGTSIKLYFPRVNDASQVIDSSKFKMTAEGGTEHILVAEDDDLVLQHVKGQLLSLGYRVTTTTSGPMALLALQEHDDVDLLLTDIIMPGGMNGRELAEQAKAAYPGLKVLFTSGYSENAIAHEGRLEPGVELLSKPYTQFELATKVRRALVNTI